MKIERKETQKPQRTKSYVIIYILDKSRNRMKIGFQGGAIL